MKRALFALIWEQWRQTWKLLAAALAVYAVYMLWVGTVTEFHNTFVFDRENAVVLAWAIMGMGAVFLFFNQSLREFQENFPRRLFTLPLRTSTLVTVHLVYKLAVALILSLVLSWTTQRVLGATNPAWGCVAVFLVGTAWAQACVCLLTAYGVWRGIGLSVLAMAAFVIGYFPIRLWLAAFVDISHKSVVPWFGVHPFAWAVLLWFILATPVILALAYYLLVHALGWAMGLAVFGAVLLGDALLRPWNAFAWRPGDAVVIHLAGTLVVAGWLVAALAAAMGGTAR